MEENITFVYDDGGRAEAGFEGKAGDCVARAIAIASGKPYKEVYKELAKRNQEAGGKRSARNGIARKVYEKYLTELGFTWIPKMKVGQGVTTHVRKDELPNGVAILRLSRHLTVSVSGEIRDTYDPSRGGTRAVYGYYLKK